MAEASKKLLQTGLGTPTLVEMCKVSIGMPVYNGASTIGTAISAVLGQTFNDFELIISDNGRLTIPS